MGIYDQPDFGRPPKEADDAPPSTLEITDYLANLADAYALPRELVHGFAQTESNFDTDKVRRDPASSSSDAASLGPESKRYGVMQVSDEHIGETLRGTDGQPLQIGPNIKNDWKANAQAGVALLAQHYQLAEIEQPFASAEEHAQQAYAGYTAGNPSRDRYLDTRADDLPANPRDRAFLQNYRQAAAASADDKAQPQDQAQASRRSPDQQPAQTQPQPPPAGSSAQSSTAGFLGRIQQLKENLGNLFLPDSLAQTLLRASSPSGASAGTAPPVSSAPSLGRIAALISQAATAAPPPASFRKPSLANVASFLLSPQETSEPSSTAGFQARIQKLEENPQNLILEPFVRGQYFSQIYVPHITINEGGNKLVPYFPGNNPERYPNAGVTIGKGVDLGQHNAEDLRKMGVPQSLIDKLSPFFQMVGPKAVDARNEVLKKDPSFSISEREAEQLNHAVMMSKFNEVGKAYNDASPIANFTDLPWQAQTVIADLWYNMGGGDPEGKSPKGLQKTEFWEQVTTGKWEDALRNLRDFRGNQKTLNDRAKDHDAPLLEQAIAADTLPRPLSPK